MIVSQLQGRLGNQMFQYAAALAIARRWNVGIRFDTRPLEDAAESFELAPFGIRCEIARDSDLPLRLRPSTPAWQRRLRGLCERAVPGIRRSLLMERRKYQFDRQAQNCGPDCFLTGYFQHEDYFAGIASEVRQLYGHSVALGAESEAFLARCQDEETVSVHLRRGDYAAVQAYRDYFGVIGPAYVRRALQALNSRLMPGRLVFFSDDLAWVEQQVLPALLQDVNGAQVTLVDWTRRHGPLEDLLLMSRMRHNIIANSTFSWWGAWLNDNPHKLVVAPDPWALKADAGIVPARWIKVPNLQELAA